MEKLIGKIKMKSFKTIIISSDGSFRFSLTCNVKVISTTKIKFVSFQKEDDKSFILNQKRHKKSIESKYSTYYKKKYLKG